jgi:antitoxin MazE
VPIIKTRIVPIGNSQGVRIPRALLKEAGLLTGDGQEVLGYEVEMHVEQGSIVLRPALGARAGWAGQFERMAEQADDLLLDDIPQASSWDEREWSW